MYSVLADGRDVTGHQPQTPEAALAEAAEHILTGAETISVQSADTTWDTLEPVEITDDLRQAAHALLRALVKFQKAFGVY